MKEELLNEHNLKLFEKFKDLGRQQNATASAVALSLLINDKKVNTFAQIGPANEEQLRASFESIKVSLDNIEINTLL